MDLYINPNKIDWLNNGEKGSAQNINRALYQYIELANFNFDYIQEQLQDGNSKLRVYNENNVSHNNVGGLVVMDESGEIESGLDIGTVINIVATSDIQISLNDEFFIDGSQTMMVDKGIIQLIKFNQNTWVVK